MVMFLCLFQLTAKDKKKQKKLDKQMHARERNRLKVMGMNPGPEDYSDENETVISNGLRSLHI